MQLILETLGRTTRLNALDVYFGRSKFPGRQRNAPVCSKSRAKAEVDVAPTGTSRGRRGRREMREEEEGEEEI